MKVIENFIERFGEEVVVRVVEEIGVGEKIGKESIARVRKYFGVIFGGEVGSFVLRYDRERFGYYSITR